MHSPENSQRHSLEQEITLALILKSHGKSATQIFKNRIVNFHMALDVSTATGWKMKRRSNSAYLAIFLTSAASPTDPAASAARIRFEDANVLTHVVSQMRQRPREYGYCYSIWSLSVAAVKTRRFEHGRYPSCRKATSIDFV